MAIPRGSPSDGDALTGATPSAQIQHFAGFGHLPWLDDAARVAARASSFLEPSA